MDTLSIPLTQGKIALIDAADAPSVLPFKWHARWCNGRWYAARSVWDAGKTSKVYMHRQLMSEPVGRLVDHEDGDGLNNRRSNLRVATDQENGRNRGSQSNSRIGLKGVSERSWNSSRPFEARIGIDGRFVHITCRQTAEEAAADYDDVAFEIFGDFAQLNFPERFSGKQRRGLPPEQIILEIRTRASASVSPDRACAICGELFASRSKTNTICDRSECKREANKRSGERFRSRHA